MTRRLRRHVAFIAQSYGYFAGRICGLQDDLGRHKVRSYAVRQGQGKLKRLCGGQHGLRAQEGCVGTLDMGGDAVGAVSGGPVGAMHGLGGNTGALEGRTRRHD